MTEDSTLTTEELDELVKDGQPPAGDPNTAPIEGHVTVLTQYGTFYTEDPQNAAYVQQGVMHYGTWAGDEKDDPAKLRLFPWTSIVLLEFVDEYEEPEDGE